MKAKIFFCTLIIASLLLVSCDNTEDNDVIIDENTNNGSSANLPDGYFEVSFAPSASDGLKAVTGADGRIQHIHYIIYKSTGEFVKEKIILTPSQGTPTWPYPVIKDTLPNGQYKAIFLGNVEKTLFPYGAPIQYSDVLTNYQTTYANARINLPPVEFASNTEYYWANVAFSNQNTTPYVLLQRIIGGFKLHRNAVDGQTALNQLVANIVTQLGYRNIIKNNVTTQLEAIRGPLRIALTPLLLLTGYLDTVVNGIIAGLVEPVTDALYQLLLKQLINEIGLTLNGNASENGTFLYLEDILNPWQNANARGAIVTMTDFPKTIDFDLAVKSTYAGSHKFRYNLNHGAQPKQEYVMIKGFNGAYNVTKINVLAQGLVSGLVVDDILDGFLLSGTFVDINDPISAGAALNKNNRRYQSDYSILDLGLKSYNNQMVGAKPLTVSVRLGSIANISGIINNILNALIGNIPLLGPVLSGILGSVVSLTLGVIENVTITSSVNLPLLGIENLTVSGGWSAVTAY